MATVIVHEASPRNPKPEEDQPSRPQIILGDMQDRSDYLGARCLRRLSHQLSPLPRDDFGISFSRLVSPTVGAAKLAARECTGVALWDVRYFSGGLYRTSLSQ